MKTLYISDLDGTLLNKNTEVSDFSIKALNRLIDKGLNFTVATARTSATARLILKDISLNIPIILMNGVFIYDTKTKKHIKSNIIEKDSVKHLLDVLKKHNITGFLYTIECDSTKNDVLNTFYENLNSEHAKAFVQERILKYNKIFTKTESFYEKQNDSVVYFSACDKRENLISVYEELACDKSLNIEFYHDIYEDGLWYLEICSSNASKFNAVQYLREQYGFEKIISFGDNLNDLPMFKASDESYAVANAKPEVKQKANAVIESNNDDGIAKWLSKNFV